MSDPASIFELPSIVLIGDLFQGWEACGPFPTYTEAAVWADEQGLHAEQFTIMTVNPPEWPEDDQT